MGLPGEACQADVSTLERGDRVLLYSDGVMEGRCPLAPSSGSNG
jgi:serine phosphatase RsbU (regulator of sigma subunit)